MAKLIHSILVTGPSGAGKSTFARRALEAEGSGLVLASPLDELDSYYGLEEPRYVKWYVDDSSYLPSVDKASVPTGLTDSVKWLRERFLEVQADAKAGKPPRYAVLILDTVSALGVLAMNATLHKLGMDKPPPALSPDGAAFYTYLRQRQEEVLRLARAFRGYGVHLIALCHVVESEVKDTTVAKTVEGKMQMHMPAVPGAFRAALPSFFSTVLSAGVMTVNKDKRYHYVQWKPDMKRPTKNRFGELDENDRIENDWLVVKAKIEQAALARINA